MMDELVRKQEVIDAVHYYIESGYKCDIFQELKNLPSAEPERTAKVIKHKYWLGISLNVVGEHTVGYEWICENCKKRVIDGDDYCSHCGCRLIWGDEHE